MRSFNGGMRLLKGISLATAIVIGASAHLPFQLNAQSASQSAQDGVLAEASVLELFSEPQSSEELKSLTASELLSRGFVKDAKGKIYKIRTRTSGTFSMSTAEAINRGFYYDSSTPRPLVRKQAGSQPHQFDPVVYAVSSQAHTYYDFGSGVASSGMSQDQLAALIAQIQAMGGEVVRDANGNIIAINFGNSAPSNYDQLYAQLLDFFNRGGNAGNGSGSGAVIWDGQPSGPSGAGFTATGDDNLDRLNAVLAGGRSGSVILGNPGGATNASGGGAVIVGSGNGNNPAGNGNTVIVGGNGNNPAGNGNGAVIVGGGNGNNPAGNGNTVIIGGNGNNPAGNGNTVIIGGNGNNPAANGTSGGIVAGGDNGSAGVRPIILNPRAQGANLGGNGDVIIQGAGNNGQGGNVIVLGGNGAAGNAGISGITAAPGAGGTGYSLVSNGNNRYLISQAGAWLNQAGLSYNDLAHNYFLFHKHLGMDVLKNDRIQNLSDIQNSKNHTSFKIGGYKYSLTKVRVKDGGFLGMGSKDVWVFTQEVTVNNETSYRLVSPEEHAMIVHYLGSMKDQGDDWKKIYNKLESRGLDSYDAESYKLAQDNALDSSKSFSAQLAQGQQVQFFAQSWSGGGGASPGTGSIIVGGGSTTAPGAQIIQGNFNPAQEAKLQELRAIFLQQNPEGTDQQFATWLMSIGSGQASSGNSALDQWILANFGSRQNQTVPPQAPSTGGAGAAASQEKTTGYIIVATELRDNNGVALFEITRFDRIGNREFNHVTEYITADKVKQDKDGNWVLIAGGSSTPSTPPSTSNPSTSTPSTPEQIVDENLARLEQVITSVNASWLDDEGNILRTGTARVEPGISASAFRSWAESQGSEVIFEDEDFDNFRAEATK